MFRESCTSRWAVCVSSCTLRVCRGAAGSLASGRTSDGSCRAVSCSVTRWWRPSDRCGRQSTRNVGGTRVLSFSSYSNNNIPVLSNLQFTALVRENYINLIMLNKIQDLYCRWSFVHGIDRLSRNLIVRLFVDQRSVTEMSNYQVYIEF